MLSGRLVALIEGNWEEIARRLIRTLRAHPDTQALAKKSDAELRDWCQEIVQNLGYWLSGGKDEEVRRRYQVLGRTRFEESIPLHEAVLRFQMLKDVIVDFVHEKGFAMTALELYAEEELEHRTCRFFDAMMYHVVTGYEDAMRLASRYA